MANSPLVVSVPEEQYAAELRELPGVDVLVWDLADDHTRADELRLVVPPYQAHVQLAERLRGARGLEVLQLLTAGYEDVLSAVPDGVALCNAAGVHDASTAELAVGLALASIRRLPEFVRAQEDGRWLRPPLGQALADSRVLVVGYGRIGQAIARRLAPFEVTLTAVASRQREGDGLVDMVHRIDELPTLAAEADVLVVVVPLSDDTRGLVDADLLARLPDGALVVNVARGPVVDTDALAAACASGRIRAAVDVTDPEPLPPGHPLWSTPGVLVSPHVGGATRAMVPRAKALLRRQVEALRDGRPLDNVVVPAGGLSPAR